MKNLSMSGQPGPGDFFMKWVWTIQAYPNHCWQVPITPLDDDPTNFVEFPSDADLADLDRIRPQIRRRGAGQRQRSRIF